MIPLKITITALYCALLLYTTFGIYVIIRGRHKLQSFRFAFFVLSLVWTLLRGAFWVSVSGGFSLEGPVGSEFLLVSFFLPTPLQCVPRASPAASGRLPHPHRAPHYFDLFPSPRPSAQVLRLLARGALLHEHPARQQGVAPATPLPVAGLRRHQPGLRIHRGRPVRARGSGGAGACGPSASARARARRR